MAVLDRMPWAAKEQVFQRLAKIAEVRNLTKEERDQYDASLKRYRDTLNVMRGARNEGLQQGLQQGLKQGQLQIARSLKMMGMSISDIAKATGLSEDEVKNV